MTPTTSDDPAVLELLARVSAICSACYRPARSLLDQHHYEITRQLLIHASDIHPKGAASVLDLDASLPAMPLVRLVRRLPWGRRGAIFQRTFRRSPTALIPLKALLESIVSQ